MKRILMLLVCGLFVLSLVGGCGQKEKTEEQSAAGAPEEMMDTTRMDSSKMDTVKQDTGMTTDTGTTQEGTH